MIGWIELANTNGGLVEISKSRRSHPNLIQSSPGPPLERDLTFCFLFLDQYLHIRCNAPPIQPLEKGLGIRNVEF